MPFLNDPDFFHRDSLNIEIMVETPIIMIYNSII